MSEDFEPSAAASKDALPPSNDRILWIMGIIGAGGAIAGAVASSFRFGLGIFLGTLLAFVNYFWLKSSLRRIFSAAATGERPRMLAGKYFLRYIVLAAVVAAIYATDLVPIVALILGLAAFGFAVVVEGLMRMFSRKAG